MTRVTGLGGVFFKCRDKPKLLEWYRRHLDLPVEAHGAWNFLWRDKDEPGRTGMTVFGFFDADTDYFNPSTKEVMFNFRVENLDAVLEALRAEGVEIDPKQEDYEYGRFAWIMDPEGNRIELWEPNAEMERKEGGKDPSAP